MPVQHVLLDADGVIQGVSPRGEQVARARLGDRLMPVLEDFWVAEQAALVGEADVVDVLAEALGRHDLGHLDVAELYERVWLDNSVDAQSIRLVHRLREAGYSVHLGTNQTARRAAHMRQDLGYDDLFEVGVYSCEIGVAKPDPRYFERSVELIDAPADSVLFVDDRADNVEAARSVGLAGVHWHLKEGHAALLERLAEHGVAVA